KKQVLGFREHTQETAPTNSRGKKTTYGVVEDFNMLLDMAGRRPILMLCTILLVLIKC
ncbi:hypothetical protein ANANG_G00084390, partial [Anguilla anguilla]